ncbi:hypothetical protein DRN94_004595 [archaeon]|nr:hypothetical protein [archaeon]
MRDYSKVIINFLLKKREASTDELKQLVPERRLYGILAVLDALGMVKRGRKKVTWVGGGNICGKAILVEGLIESITHSPIRIKIVGKEPLKVKIAEEV